MVNEDIKGLVFLYNTKKIYVRVYVVDFVVRGKDMHFVLKSLPNFVEGPRSSLDWLLSYGIFSIKISLS